MKKWNMYQKNSSEIEAVKEGFSWWAFFFVGLWAFSKGLMWAGAIGLSFAIAAGRMPGAADIITIPMIAVLMLVYGVMGNGWVATRLEKQGYSHEKQIEAASAEGAKAKFHEASGSSHDLQRQLGALSEKGGTNNNHGFAYKTGRALGELSKNGGTSKVALIVAFSAIIWILAAIAKPAYDAYQKRTAYPFVDPNSGADLVMPYEKRAWSGNIYDQFDSVEDIERQARNNHLRLNDPRAWDAVMAWQNWYMHDTKKEANAALYMAVDTVLEGLKENKEICRPGNVITVNAATASKDIPAGSEMVQIDCGP